MDATWSAPRKLTNGNRPNIFHKLVRTPDGTLHLVWVGYQNAQSHVLWSKLTGDTWSQPQEISGASAWMPAVAADSHGNLYVAWDSYRTGNYDIFMRRISRQWGDGRHSAGHQVFALPGARLGGCGWSRTALWLAWDESGSNWGKDFSRDDTWRGTTLYANRRPRVAVLEDGKWSEPVADPMGAVPKRYNRYVEGPQARQ